MRCLNCDSEVHGRYCSNCGQNVHTERFDGRYLLHKTIQSFDLDRGVVHTLWVLLIRPGHAIRQYLQGQRIGFSNPINLFLIIGAIATYFTYNHDFFRGIDVAEDAFPVPDVLEYFDYSTKYFSFFNLSGLPLFTLFTWVFFFKRPYNGIELLVLNVYIAIGQLLITIFFFFIYFLYSDADLLFNIYGLLTFGYGLWALLTFFQVKTWKGWVQAVLATAIPSVIVPYYNYIVYKLAPPAFWAFLDNLLG